VGILLHIKREEAGIILLFSFRGVPASFKPDAKYYLILELTDDPLILLWGTSEIFVKYTIAYGVNANSTRGSSSTI